MKTLLNGYKMVFEFESFLETKEIVQNDNIELPFCIEKDTLPFALNAFDWDVMWGASMNLVSVTKRKK